LMHSPGNGRTSPPSSAPAALDPRPSPEDFVLDWCWLILAALGMLALVTLLVTLFHDLASARPRSVWAFYSVGDHIQ
jgi:hypothetical protein